ncbi:uncharacterized protein N7479_008736 [Penicillium vulpinum]|uniref:uncharacterized protein n=1 Tax=Penicillium vulpinum TaxID=29845 RepID=UPI0025471C58|nr:uncharacterized protein N7479_008736 [Penicillium vulpinum]KAJ5950323.1 hypothetical protein N7479_008736 [Penicillium vulpinum]
MQPSEYSPRDTDPPETAASTALILMPSNPAPKGWKHTITNPNPNLDAPLESLPPEIRRHLLSMMELDALKSLVHASPVFHQQYLLDRKWVLCRSLAATLRSNSLIYEVRAVYESGLKTFWDTRTKPTVKQFVKAYRQGRSSSHNSPFSEAVTLSKELTLEEVLYLAKFHFLIIQPLMQKYINCTSTFLTVGLHVPYDQKKGGLREIEEMRLLRAFYRFQICCNLFGHGYNGRNFRGAPGFAAMEVSALLESLFEPWEIEGIVCIYEFVIGSYERVLPVDWNGHSPFPRQYQYPFFLQRTRFLTDLSEIFQLPTFMIACSTTNTIFQQHTGFYLGRSHEALGASVTCYSRIHILHTPGGPFKISTLIQ